MTDIVNTQMLGIYSLNAPTAITASAKVEEFEKGKDVNVIARGSILQFTRFEDNKIVVEYEYHLFGDVIQLIPLSHPRDNQSNILVILNDDRFCVLRYTTEVTCVQCGNLQSSYGIPVDPPYKYAIGEYALLIQLREQILQYFCITQQSTLAPPNNWTIPCIVIKDFQFVDTTEDGSRVIMLTKDYGAPIKMQIYDITCYSHSINPKSHDITIDLPEDAYRLHVLSDTAIVVFATRAAYRLIFHTEYHPTQQSYTIYTSHPIVFIEKLSGSTYVATDSGNNLLYLNLPESGIIKIIRISGINHPVALIGVDSTSAISISKYGTSNLISAINDGDFVKLNSITLLNNPGPIKTILEISSNDIMGICEQNVAHIIRKSLQTEEMATMTIPNLKNVWFDNDPKRFVVSYGNETGHLNYKDGKLEIIPSSKIITDQPTLMFKSCNDGFIQITNECINVQNNQTSKKAIYESIVNASISQSNIGAITRKDESDLLIISDLAGNVTAQIELPIHCEEIAINGEYVAVSSWNREQILIYSCSNNEIVRTINHFAAVSIKFTDNYFVALESKDKCNFYSLKNENEIITIQCPGFHSTIIRIEGDDVIIGGENPYVIKDCILHGIETSLFTTGDYYDSYCLLIYGDDLKYVESDCYEMDVQQEKMTVDIIDAVQIANSSRYIIAYRDKGDMFKLTTVDHPRAQQSSYEPGSDSFPLSQYVGMASIRTHDVSFVALALSASVILFEINNKLIEHRSSRELKFHPYAIKPYEEMIAIGFETEFVVYDLDFVSLSKVQLNEFARATTQGSSCCMACKPNEKLIAIGDELQSLVIYSLEEDKFTEIARSSYQFIGINQCILSDDFYYAIDLQGNFYQMEICNIKNIESSELKVMGCYSLGQGVSSVIKLKSKDKIIIGTYESQYIEAVPIDFDETFDVLYKGIEQYFQSLGHLSSKQYRQVTTATYALPYPVFYNLDLLAYFMQLDVKDQSLIASDYHLSVQEAKTICENILSLT